MITRLTEHLYRVISDLNIILERGFHADLKPHYMALTNSINEFKETPEILYKELFEPWCKEDFCRFCRLINIIQNKDFEWQMNSISLLPQFIVMFNELCKIYDEIEMRQPEIVKGVDAETTEGLRLPDELNTERARKYFARAVEAQFMELTPTGAKWLFGGDRGKARLAYFLERVYCPEPTDALQAPQCRVLEQYFSVHRLDRAIQQNADTGKSPAVKQWRADIDNLFTD